MVANMLDGAKPDDAKTEPPVASRDPRESDNTGPPVSLTTRERNRTNSLTSLDGGVRSLRSRASLKDALVSFPDKGSRRLAFADYLIKPIQRICKYPLLLDQLKGGKGARALSTGYLGARPDVNVVVESASQAMRHVASAVDEARHRQDVAMQSSLIVSRIFPTNPTSSQSSSSFPTFQSLTPSFFTSLGICLLAGSLDVMHYQSSNGSAANINAKYLGAFLYLGGYLILVKVTRGKVYEPRHWFPLSDFDIFDLEEDDGEIPFHLSSRCDLTYACRRSILTLHIPLVM